MITADTLRRCTNLNSTQVESLIRKNYPKDRVLSSDFLGITNAGQFAYNCKFKENGNLIQCKIFVWQNNNGELEAEYQVEFG